MVFPKKNPTGIWSSFFPKISSYSLDRKWKIIFLKKVHGNMIFSSNVLKRWSFQKNPTGIWSFLYYLERWYFFFLKIWSYSLDGKWKMIFLKKIHGNMIFSSNDPKRWSSQKKSCLNMIFLVLSGKMVFFFRKIYFFFGRKMEDDLSQEIHGNMIFSVYMYKCYKYDITLLKKHQRWSSPEKLHLKMIDIVDRILERVPMILCTFMETFIGAFMHCFPVKKNKKKNMKINI